MEYSTFQCLCTVHALLWFGAGGLYIQSDAIITHVIAYTTAVTEPEYESEFEPTKDTSYLTHKYELWGVFCEGCDNF